MWVLYTISTALFLIPLLAILVYALLIYLVIALPLRILSLALEKKRNRHLLDSRGVQRYRGWGWKVGIYARNIALSLPDQGLATFLGQSPDISISEALGLAMVMHESGDAKVSGFIRQFAKLVDWLFWNPLWKIEKNHVRSSLDPGEKFYNTLSHWHFSDALTGSRDVSQYIKDHT